MGNQTHGIDPVIIDNYAKEIKKVFDQGIEIAIVIGGGNIFRGISGASKGMDRVQADYMGMLATVINGLALQGALENNNVPTRLQTAIKIEAIAEPFIKRKATRHLEKGRVVIFGSGTGHFIRALYGVVGRDEGELRSGGVLDRDGLRSRRAVSSIVGGGERANDHVVASGIASRGFA